MFRQHDAGGISTVRYPPRAQTSEHSVRQGANMSDGKPSEGVFEEYKKGEDVPLFSYGVLVGTFNLLFALFLLAARITGRPIPERMDAKDIALLGMATHKISLVGSQDAITSP